MRLSRSHIADDEWRAMFMDDNPRLTPRGFGVGRRHGVRCRWRRGGRWARTAAMCDDAAEKELREECERMSDVELLAVVVSDEYRDDVRQLARRVLAARLGVPGVDTDLIITAAVTALKLRAAQCHLCVAATDVAERHEFLVC
jgi:hypothetical protein